MVTHVSPAYGGSASDRQIVERGDLPGKCDPKDSIMFDKGFNVQNIFAPYDVEINIPAFFKKKNRLDKATLLKALQARGFTLKGSLGSEKPRESCIAQ
jgi:hypothetical protein